MDKLTKLPASPLVCEDREIIGSEAIKGFQGCARGKICLNVKLTIKINGNMKQRYIIKNNWLLNKL
jgi:hypothetical protein